MNCDNKTLADYADEGEQIDQIDWQPLTRC